MNIAFPILHMYFKHLGLFLILVNPDTFLFSRLYVQKSFICARVFDYELVAITRSFFCNI